MRDFSYQEYQYREPYAERGRRQRPQKGRHDRKRDVLAVLVLLVLAFFAVRFAVQYVAYLGLHFLTVESVSDTAVADVQLLLIREEIPVTAPVAGTFRPEAAEGSRLTGGSRVGTVDDGSDLYSVDSPRAGVVYYQLDGWENLVSVSNAAETDWQQVVSLWESEEPSASGNMSPGVEENETVARIVDNLVPDHIFICSNMMLTGFLANDRLTFRYEDENGTLQTLTASVYEQGQLSDQLWYALAVLPGHVQNLANQRWLEGELLGATSTGLSVPTDIVFPGEDGNRGVYRVAGKRLEYVPVEISAYLGDTVQLSGVEEGDVLVSNPARAHADQRIFGWADK